MFRTENECMKTCQLPEINPEKNPESNPEINTEINPEINPKINSEQPVEDVCSLEVDPGSCSTYPSYYYRYYFDINDQKCKMFTFCGYRGKTCILLNDGAKRNRLLYLKIMHSAIRKIIHLHIFW